MIHLLSRPACSNLPSTLPSPNLQNNQQQKEQQAANSRSSKQLTAAEAADKATNTLPRNSAGLGTWPLVAA